MDSISKSISKSKREKLKRILKNPLVVIGASVLGGFIGFYNKEVGLFLGPLGKMYIYFLQMSVIPIIISSIISNIAKLIGSSEVREFTFKAVAIFVFVSLSFSFFGVISGIIFQPGNFSKENQDIINSFIESSENQVDLELNLLTANNIPVKEEKSLLEFFSEIIPSNIFASLSTGSALELVFFFVVLGIGVGLIKKEKGGEMIIEISTALFLTFQKVINWALYLLPFGLVCLIANQVATTGLDIVFPLIKYIALFYGVGLVLILINFIITWRRANLSMVEVLRGILEVNIIAFTTRSSFACIPSSVTSLESNLGFDRVTVNLFTPLGITLGRYGNILYFSLTTIFIAQIYNSELSVNEIIITVIGAILAGLATAGATGIATLSALSITTVYLGLPLDVILIVLVALDVVIDPMRTLLIVNTNLMCGSLISKKYTGGRTKKVEI